MADKIHGFPAGSHQAEVEKHVRNIPGKSSGAVHGGGVVPKPGPTPMQDAYK